MRRLGFLVLILAGCGSASTPGPSPTPPASTAGDDTQSGPAFTSQALTEWWEAPTAAACTVHVTQTSGEQVLESVRYFESGRQVSGTSHPSLGSDGQSRVTYDAGRVTRIDFQRADPEDGLECDAIDCYVPPSRTRGVRELRYDDDGHLLGMFDRQTVYEQDGTEWRSTRAREQALTFTYDSEGRRVGFHSTMGSEASGTLTYDGPRLVSRHLERDDFEVDMNYRYDEDGRVVSRTRVSCASECSEPHTTLVEYDAQGRVTATRAPDRAVQYTYDADGHLTSQNAGTPIRYVYQGGRLAEIRHDPAGRSTTQYRYEGECDDVDLSPHAPSPYEGSELEVCVHDPVYALVSCLPVE